MAAIGKAGRRAGTARLKRYWSTGQLGGAKIMWGVPGDFTRCVNATRKHLGTKAQGYCANLHKRNTGTWPGSKAGKRV